MIRSRRKERRYSQESLAYELGKSQSYVSMLETNQVGRPSNDVLNALSLVLGFDRNELEEAFGPEWMPDEIATNAIVQIRPLIEAFDERVQTFKKASSHIWVTITADKVEPGHHIYVPREPVGDTINIGFVGVVVGWHVIHKQRTSEPIVANWVILVEEVGGSAIAQLVLTPGQEVWKRVEVSDAAASE